MHGKNTDLRYKQEEYFVSPHSACPGCSIPLALRYFLRATGEKVILVIPPGCSSVIVNIPERRLLYRGGLIGALACPFGSAVTFASGMKTALGMKGDGETQVVAWAGDGATFDIGLGAISAAAERNEDIIYVCYDNEAYQNTGNQRSSASPAQSINSTNPLGMSKLEQKKDIAAILLAHRIPYLATATVAYPDDFIKKIKKAMNIQGFRFFHVLTPCPTGWGFPASQTLSLSRLAVQTRVFPLFEVEDGSTVTMSKMPSRKISVAEYLSKQKRFDFCGKGDKGDSEWMETEFQKDVEKRWERLLSFAT